MPTTNKAFYFVEATGATGGGVCKAIPALCIEGYSAADPDAIRVDYIHGDFSVAGYSKSCAARLTFTGATSKTIDLTDISGAADIYSGDTNFGSSKQIHFLSDGGSTIKVEPGSTNSATIDFTRLDVRDGARVVLCSEAGTTVDATHCNIKFTSNSDGSIWIVVGGS